MSWPGMCRLKVQLTHVIKLLVVLISRRASSAKVKQHFKLDCQLFVAHVARPLPIIKKIVNFYSGSEQFD